jgi:hypothetical protein
LLWLGFSDFGRECCGLGCGAEWLGAGLGKYGREAMLGVPQGQVLGLVQGFFGGAGLGHEGTGAIADALSGSWWLCSRC